MNPPQMSLNMPTSGSDGSSASRPTHSGWAWATSEDGDTMNGASQIPGVNPAAAMDVATPSTPEGNRSLVTSQSPTADWNPSSSWNTPKGQSPANARLSRTSASATPSK
jgi:hypothetical protein